MLADVKVKICGLSTLEDIIHVNKLIPDYIGLVMVDKSPRNVSLDCARNLKMHLKPQIDCVVVLSDPSLDDIAMVVEQINPDYIQLHGFESIEFCQAVTKLYGCYIIKAIESKPDNLKNSYNSYSKVCSKILIDSVPPIGAKRRGGNGIKADWNMIREILPSKNFILSGGLNSENVIKAIGCSGAVGVDVSSGVEDSLGHKNRDLVSSFLTSLRPVD